MQGLARTLLLTTAFGLMLWFALRYSPEAPRQEGTASPPAAEEDAISGGDQGQWSHEERALWRDTIDQRLRR